MKHSFLTKKCGEVWGLLDLPTQNLKRKVLTILAIGLSMFAGSETFAQCNVQAYSGTISAGNQPYTERLGMVFTVNSPIMVNELGAFDSNQDGLQSAIEVGIIRTDGTVMAGPVTLSGSSDPLSGNHRMRSIPTVILQPGDYVIVAVGYSNVEMNGNINFGGSRVSTNPGGGQLTFIGGSFGGAGFGLPLSSWIEPDGFHAGTFRYSSLTPALQLTVNGFQITNDNDGAEDTEDLLVCNTTNNNLFFTQFA